MAKVSVGDHVMYAVPKPPQKTTYAHGVVKSIKTSGMVKIDGTNESFEASKDKPVATIEVWAVDEDGNPKSKTDRVVAKPISELRVSSKPISQEAAADSTLKDIMSEYNKTAPDGRKVTMGTLRQVYNRGIGAYKTNPSSVRPNVVSAEQWAYGRVRAFLKMLKNGKAPRKPFDQDLLPESHPLSSKGSKKEKAVDGMVKEGDYVSFMMDGEVHTGRVEHVMVDGYFGMPGSKFYSPATKDQPAVLIRIWDDGEESELMTGRMLSEVKIINPPSQDAAVEKRLYFKVQKGAKGCPIDKPYGVVGEKSGVVHGCHTNEASAQKHLAAIYAATDPKNGYKPASKETKKDMETPKQHDERVARESKSSEEPVVSFEFDSDSARMYTVDERKSMAKSGQALPDGSFPIANVEDLKNAIQAFGRAKNKPAAKRHIMKRARELKSENLIPENWM